MGTFKTSEGERLSKTTIDSLIRKAKKALTDEAVEEGKAYCWSCGTTKDRLSCSHIISVNKCQNDGMAEVAYLTDNMQLECLLCHAETERGTIDHHANASYKKKFIEMYNNRKV
jgi:hypothetical protein